MVSRAPQPTEPFATTRQVNGTSAQRKSAQEVSVQSKRTTAGKGSAQDVAELKDFVGQQPTEPWKFSGLQMGLFVATG